MKKQPILPGAITIRAQGGKLNVIKTDVEIHQPKKSITEIVPALQISAIWDTGATGSVITSKIVQKLNLKPISRKQVRGVHGINIVNVYFVEISFPNIAHIRTQVTECTSLGDADALIGMDIICHGDFSITNESSGETIFSFQYPSTHSVDYVKEINRKQDNINQNQHKIQMQKNRRAKRKK